MGPQKSTWGAVYPDHLLGMESMPLSLLSLLSLLLLLLLLSLLSVASLSRLEEEDEVPRLLLCWDRLWSSRLVALLSREALALGLGLELALGLCSLGMGWQISAGGCCRRCRWYRLYGLLGPSVNGLSRDVEVLQRRLDLE